jgi:hypothetical protein
METIWVWDGITLGFLTGGDTIPGTDPGEPTRGMVGDGVMVDSTILGLGVLGEVLDIIHFTIIFTPTHTATGDIQILGTETMPTDTAEADAAILTTIKTDKAVAIHKATILPHID